MLVKTKRWRWLWFVGGVAVVLVMREFGPVDLSVYTSKSSSDLQSLWPNANEAELPANRWTCYTTARDAEQRSVSVSQCDGADGRVATGRLTRFDAEGVWWLPLRKTGTVAFAAEIESPVGVRSGTAEGHVTLTITGPCSTRRFKRLLCDAALDCVENTMKGHF